MYIYLDESGDLGFGEGNTKYFTIAFVIIEEPKKFRSCVKSAKMKYNIIKNDELKGAKSRKIIKEDLLRRLSTLDLEINAITVRKDNVDFRLRKNSNILYNYIVDLSLVGRLLEEPPNTSTILSVDKRITSVTSGFNFSYYLKYKIWYEAERGDIELDILHLDSHQAYAIQGIDVICSSIFRKYSSNNYELFDIIQEKVKSDKKLLFNQ